MYLMCLDFAVRDMCVWATGVDAFPLGSRSLHARFPCGGAFA